MENLLNTLWFGIREPFKRAGYIFLFISLFLVMLALFVFIPIWVVPGNTIAIQLDIFVFRDYAVFFLLSFLSSLFISMQVYVIRERRKKLKGASMAAGGGLGALFAGIAGTAFCASCLAPLFAFFGIGFGGVVFVLSYRWYFVVAIVLLMFIAIYLTSQNINKTCISCRIGDKGK